MHVTAPQNLWYAALAAGILLFAWRTRLNLAPGRRRLLAALRVLVMLLLAAGLAGVVAPLGGGRRCTIFLVDVSKSINAEVYGRMRGYVDRLRGGTHHIFGAVLFAGKARLAVAPGAATALSEQPPDDLENDQTDLAAAIRLGLASLPEGAECRIVLLSDGNATRGDAVGEARRAAAYDAPLDAVGFRTRQQTDAVVARLEASHTHVYQGSVVELRALLRSNADMRGTVDLLEDGVRVETRPVDLRAGAPMTLAFEREMERKGFHAFEAVFYADADLRPENNRGMAFVEVAGRPSVMLVDGREEDARFLAAALEKEGIAVELRPPEGVPRSLKDLDAYDLLVFSDLSSLTLTGAQMELIQAYVRDLGGGFLMVGGEQSFGLGGYYQTPIEDVLPVQMLNPEEKRRVHSAVVLVLDKSGSMSGSAETVRKIDLVKEAAIQVVNLLRAEDLVGVAVFDSQAAWLVPLRRAQPKRPITEAVSTLDAGGGTSIFPGLQLAYDALASAHTQVKHVILLSDGHSTPGDYAGICAAMRRGRITVSAIAVGPGADAATLQQIAEWGGGEFYYSADATDVPRVFTRDTMKHAKSAIVEEPFRPRVAESSRVTRGIDFDLSPFLFGYVTTSAKSTASVPLLAPGNEPLYATWRYGAGKAAAFTSDCKSRWARLWIERWPGYAKFWTAAVRDTMRESRGRNMECRAAVRGSDAAVEVELYGPDATFVNDAELRADLYFVPPYAGGTGSRLGAVPLRQVAPGRYAGGARLERDGAYLVKVSWGERTATTGFSRAFPAEYFGLATDEGFLKELARAGGGAYAAEPDIPVAPRAAAVRSGRDLFDHFLVAALGVFLFDVAARRVHRWRDLLG